MTAEFLFIIVIGAILLVRGDLAARDRAAPGVVAVYVLLAILLVTSGAFGILWQVDW